MTDEVKGDIITDPETGEVLATEATREMVYVAALADFADATLELEEAKDRRDRAKRALLALWREGYRPLVRGERVFVVELVKPPRQVDKVRLEDESERLPTTLVPRTETREVTETTYPKVGQIEAAAPALAAAGFLPGDFLVSLDPHPAVKVKDL